MVAGGQADSNAEIGVEPREKHEEELETELADHGLEDVTRYFSPRQQYRGRGK